MSTLAKHLVFIGCEQCAELGGRKTSSACVAAGAVENSAVTVLHGLRNPTVGHGQAGLGRWHSANCGDGGHSSDPEQQR